MPQNGTFNNEPNSLVFYSKCYIESWFHSTNKIIEFKLIIFAEYMFECGDGVNRIKLMHLRYETELA